MPSINMIAARRAEKKKQEQNVRKLVYAVVGEVGLVFLALSILSLKLVTTNAQAASLDNQLSKLQPKVAQIHDIQAKIATITPRVAMLTGAKADTMFWYNGIYHITASLADKTWLSGISTTTGTSAAGFGGPGTAEADSPSISLQGDALNPNMVGDTILHLNAMPCVDKVDLSFVQHQLVGATDAVAFQMNVHLKPEPSDAPPAKPAGATNATKS